MEEVYTEEALFERLVKLETDKLTASADIAQLKKDFKYDEEENPKGLKKEVIPLIAGAAKLHAKNDFEEKQANAKAIFQKYEELTNYGD